MLIVLTPRRPRRPVTPAVASAASRFFRKLEIAEEQAESGLPECCQLLNLVQLQSAEEQLAEELLVAEFDNVLGLSEVA